ncbi:hypothetical protein [[Scytonema hofmanni] UTEX B 1581]|uniref:hypothetical protein n=1 Tax=[Scytonema hofmanni] UTEX B 1581 TaxID=379535 RepID=UPI001640F729|nr:hypothetical protein [[Scytonema hofmanni] UTEX B 1581]
MPKHTLFVCKSYHRSSEERPKNQTADDTILLDKTNSLCKGKFPSEEKELLC